MNERWSFGRVRVDVHGGFHGSWFVSWFVLVFPMENENKIHDHEDKVHGQSSELVTTVANHDDCISQLVQS